MCGKKPKTPKVVERDLEAEKRLAEGQAQQAANASTAQQRRRRGTGGAGAMVAQVQSMRATQQQIGANSLLAQTKPKP